MKGSFLQAEQKMWMPPLLYFFRMGIPGTEPDCLGQDGSAMEQGRPNFQNRKIANSKSLSPGKFQGMTSS
jgi:hypothetical protein